MTKKTLLTELLEAIGTAGLISLVVGWLVSKLRPGHPIVACCPCRLWRQRAANALAFLVLVALTVATVKLVWRIC